MRKVFAVLAAIALVGGWWFLSSNAGQMLMGRWSFTDSANIDSGTFFRLKFDVAYKGEPQHFDIVVGCNVLDLYYKDGSNTHEVGLVPTLYGQRMRDGKGLVVRPRTPAMGKPLPMATFRPTLFRFSLSSRMQTHWNSAPHICRKTPMTVRCLR